MAFSSSSAGGYSASQNGLAPWQKCLRTSGVNKALAAQGHHPDWDANIVLCEEAVRLERDAPKVSFSLGALAQAYERKNQLDAAISLYLEAIRVMPTPNLDLHLSLARLYRRVGQPTEAAAVYEKIIRLEPENPRGFFQLGKTRLEESRWEDALASFQDALRLKPNMAEAHLGLGKAYEKMDQWDKAQEAYEEALRLEPDRALAHLGLGRTYRHQGLLEEAIASYLEAIRLERGLAEAHYELGLAYCQRGDVDSCIAAYREAARLKPDLAEAHFGLGVAYAQKHRRALADDSLYQAAELYIEAGDRRGALMAYGRLRSIKSPLAFRVYRRLYP